MYVKSNLMHNGRSYKKGDQIEISGSEAEALVKDGVLTSKPVLSDEVEHAPEVIPGVESGSEEEAEAEEEVEEEVITPEEEAAGAVEPKVQSYIVTQADVDNNPALSEKGLTAGTEVWLKPEAIAQVATPGFLTSVLKTEEELAAEAAEAADNL